MKGLSDPVRMILLNIRELNKMRMPESFQATVDAVAGEFAVVVRPFSI